MFWTSEEFSLLVPSLLPSPTPLLPSTLLHSQPPCSFYLPPFTFHLPPLSSLRILGIKAFSFTLIETDGFKKLGRYIESLTFFVRPLEYTSARGDLKVNYQMGFGAPATVLRSKLRLTLTPTLLQFADPVLRPQNSASCPICYSGTLFNCANQGLPDSTTCTKKLQ